MYNVELDDLTKLEPYLQKIRNKKFSYNARQRQTLKEPICIKERKRTERCAKHGDCTSAARRAARHGGTQKPPMRSKAYLMHMKCAGVRRRPHGGLLRV
jgi:hypothetical protein